MTTPRTRALGLLAGTLLLLLAAPLAAWSATPLEVTASPVEAGAFPENRLTVRAIGSDGLPLTGLGTKDFEVLEDGTPAQVAGVDAVLDTQMSMSTLLVMDTSARMQGQPLVDAQGALNSFVDQAGASDQMALLAVGNESCQWALGQRFTADKTAVKGAIGNVHAAGDAPLLTSLMAGLKLTRELPMGHKMLVLLSSGKDACQTTYQVDDVINEAKAQSIPIFAVGLGSTVEKDVLQRLADTTRGEYYGADTSSQLRAIYQQISARLRTQYALKYRSALLSDGKDHTVSVRLSYQGNQAASPEQRYTPPEPPIQLQVLNATNDQPIAADQRVDAALPIKVSSASPVLLTKVDYSLDGVALASVTSAPFTYTLEPGGRSNGPHTLKVTATTWSGKVAEAERPLQLSATGLPTWVLILAALLLIILAPLGVFLLAGTRARTCPRCGKKMDPAWKECPYHPELALAGAGPMVGAGMPGVPPTRPSAPPPPSASAKTGGTAGISAVAGAQSTVGGGGPSLGGPPSAERTILLGGAPPPLAWLVVSKGPRAGQQYPLGDQELSLGRDPSLNTVVLDDTSASGRHARVRRVNGSYQLTDLDTTNGTLVNGRRVARHQLRPNDRITIGETELVFSSAEPSLAPR